MGRLDGRVAIVTGAGRGLGREHALRLAEGGASVVVNDLGCGRAGEGRDDSPALAVVDDIVSRGGRAMVSGHDVSDWSEAADLIRFAVESFGDLHVLVNNAGIYGSNTLDGMREEEWDRFIRINLKGHAAPTSHAMTYWSARSKAGHSVAASIIHTTSASGTMGFYGQAHYGAAKLAAIALSSTAAIEGAAIGVRSNTLSPSARTRMTADELGPEKKRPFNDRDPAHVSPLVAWLADEKCPANGQVYAIFGRRILIYDIVTFAHELAAPGQWTLEELDRELPPRLVKSMNVEAYFRHLGETE